MSKHILNNRIQIIRRALMMYDDYTVTDDRIWFEGPGKNDWVHVTKGVNQICIDLNISIKLEDNYPHIKIIIEL